MCVHTGRTKNIITRITLYAKVLFKLKADRTNEVLIGTFLFTVIDIALCTVRGTRYINGYVYMYIYTVNMVQVKKKKKKKKPIRYIEIVGSSIISVFYIKNLISPY